MRGRKRVAPAKSTSRGMRGARVDEVCLAFAGAEAVAPSTTAGAAPAAGAGAASTTSGVASRATVITAPAMAAAAAPAASTSNPTSGSGERFIGAPLVEGGQGRAKSGRPTKLVRQEATRGRHGRA